MSTAITTIAQGQFAQRALGIVGQVKALQTSLAEGTKVPVGNRTPGSTEQASVALTAEQTVAALGTDAAKIQAAVNAFVAALEA